MKKIIVTLCTVVISALWLAVAMNAFADDTIKHCVRDASKEFKVCKDICQENFQVDKDECRNIDHACAEACRAGFETCSLIPLSTLEACKDVCYSDLQAAVQLCRSQNAVGTEELDACIDQAQVQAFMCRDECREGVKGELRQCRVAHRDCIRSCPPPVIQ